MSPRADCLQKRDHRKNKQKYWNLLEVKGQYCIQKRGNLKPYIWHEYTRTVISQLSPRTEFWPSHRDIPAHATALCRPAWHLSHQLCFVLYASTNVLQPSPKTHASHAVMSAQSWALAYILCLTVTGFLLQRCLHQLAMEEGLKAGKNWPTISLKFKRYRIVLIVQVVNYDHYMSINMLTVSPL